MNFFSTEKPQLSMEDVSTKPGENAVMTCEIYGYPASSVVWSFIPCNKPEFDVNSCDESKKVEYVSGDEIFFFLIWVPLLYLFLDFNTEIGHLIFMFGTFFCMFY